MAYLKTLVLLYATAAVMAHPMSLLELIQVGETQVAPMSTVNITVSSYNVR